MIENELLESLKKKAQAGESSLTLTRGELLTLLELLEIKSKRVGELEKKAEVLTAHVMELTQEMENIKSDFGNNR